MAESVQPDAILTGRHLRRRWMGKQFAGPDFVADGDGEGNQELLVEHSAGGAALRCCCFETPEAESSPTVKGDGVGNTIVWDGKRKTFDAWMKAARQDGIPWSFIVNGDGAIAYIGYPG